MLLVFKCYIFAIILFTIAKSIFCPIANTADIGVVYCLLFSHFQFSVNINRYNSYVWIMLRPIKNMGIRTICRFQFNYVFSVCFLLLRLVVSCTVLIHNPTTIVSYLFRWVENLSWTILKPFVFDCDMRFR